MKFSNLIEKIGVVFAYLTCVLAYTEISQKCKGNPHFPNSNIMKQILDKWRWEDGEDQPFFMENSANLGLYPNTAPKTKPEHLKPLIFALSRDRKCPKSIKHLTRKKNKETRQKSNCPWYYEMNYDRLRFPSVLLTARCKCSSCVGQKAYNTTCEPLIIQQKVLRVKTDPDGNPACQTNTSTYELHKDVEDVAVGCTCVYQSPDKVAKPETYPKAPE